jgi:AraC family ethanolamine operon transcriptional activator
LATLTTAVLDRSGPPATGIVDLRATTCEELAAASVGWDVRYVQQGSGRCRAHHVGLRTRHLHIVVESWSLGMVKMGRGPRGWVTFLVPAGGGSAARIQGVRAAAGEVVVFLDGDEFDYRTAGPARLVSVSIERGVLERHVRDLCGRCFGELRLQGRLGGLRTDAAALRRYCFELVARAAARPARFREPARDDSVVSSLVKALLEGFDHAGRSSVPSRGRALALRAEAWLRQNLAEPPTIAAVCEALNASERTLHEAFREHLDTTPKAYLKTLRLNAARRDLLAGPGRRRVTDVALDWGFLHFGWFSQDYRRLFGETPSQTLHGSRSERGVHGSESLGARPAPRLAVTMAASL